MKRINRAPVQAQDIPPQISSRAGFEYRTLASNAATADMRTPRCTTTLMTWPDGMTAPWGSARELEYHTLHEEIFVLAGALCFDHWYRLDAPAYCNHPPFWVHPTNFWAEGELVMLMRASLDPIVQLEAVPPEYVGEDFYAPGKPTYATYGVSHLQLDDLPWRPVLRRDGEATGIMGKRIWADADDHWVTWLMRVPSGWALSAADLRWAGGDEVFVLEGSIQILHQGSAARLERHGFMAETSEFTASAGWSSESGCLFIRWMKNADAAWCVD